jgi:hypothetical protein
MAGEKIHWIEAADPGPAAARAVGKGPGRIGGAICAVGARTEKTDPVQAVQGNGISRGRAGKAWGNLATPRITGRIAAR